MIDSDIDPHPLRRPLQHPGRHPGIHKGSRPKTRLVSTLGRHRQPDAIIGVSEAISMASPRRTVHRRGVITISV